MSARSVERNLRCSFLTKMKNLNARHAARKNRPGKCPPLDFPRGINSDHPQQAPVHHARAADHPIVRVVRKHSPQVIFFEQTQKKDIHKDCK